MPQHPKASTIMSPKPAATPSPKGSALNFLASSSTSSPSMIPNKSLSQSSDATQLPVPKSPVHAANVGNWTIPTIPTDDDEKQQQQQQEQEQQSNSTSNANVDPKSIKTLLQSKSSMDGIPTLSQLPTSASFNQLQLQQHQQNAQSSPTSTTATASATVTAPLSPSPAPIPATSSKLNNSASTQTAPNKSSLSVVNSPPRVITFHSPINEKLNEQIALPLPVTRNGGSNNSTASSSSSIDNPKRLNPSLVDRFSKSSNNGNSSSITAAPSIPSNPPQFKSLTPSSPRTMTAAPAALSANKNNSNTNLSSSSSSALTSSQQSNQTNATKDSLSITYTQANHATPNNSSVSSFQPSSLSAHDDGSMTPIPSDQKRTLAKPSSIATLTVSPGGSNVARHLTTKSVTTTPSAATATTQSISAKCSSTSNFAISPTAALNDTSSNEEDDDDIEADTLDVTSQSAVSTGAKDWRLIIRNYPNPQSADDRIPKSISSSQSNYTPVTVFADEVVRIDDWDVARDGSGSWLRATVLGRHFQFESSEQQSQLPTTTGLIPQSLIRTIDEYCILSMDAEGGDVAAAAAIQSTGSNPSSASKAALDDANSSTPKDKSFLDRIRGAVSKKKRRYIRDGFDLDLSFITSQLIGMGFPSSNFSSMFRNSMTDVKRFFNTKFESHYMIYNLCSERSYEPKEFDNCVLRVPFDDHNPCALAVIEPFCVEVHRHLIKSPLAVAAIHCKAGKGRTGLMIACYMLHSRLFSDASQSLYFYAIRRTKNAKGVTIPSQIRYVHYYSQLLNLARMHSPGYTLPEHQTLQLIRVRLLGQMHTVGPVGKREIWFKLTNNSIKYNSKGGGSSGKALQVRRDDNCCEFAHDLLASSAGDQPSTPSTGKPQSSFSQTSGSTPSSPSNSSSSSSLRPICTLNHDFCLVFTYGSAFESDKKLFQVWLNTRFIIPQLALDSSAAQLAHVKPSIAVLGFIQSSNNTNKQSSAAKSASATSTVSSSTSSSTMTLTLGKAHLDKITKDVKHSKASEDFRLELTFQTIT